jgi:hypothetical protein
VASADKASKGINATLASFPFKSAIRKARFEMKKLERRALVTNWGFSLRIPLRAYTSSGMTLRELKTNLLEHRDKHLRFVLPNGDAIAADFHITEIGHVVKNFIDCGGTKRKMEAIVLQAWVAANDPDHRLTAGKLTTIIDLADGILPSDELDVEVEYEGCAISQYPVSSVGAESNELRFTLVSKHTDCLAREACGLESCGSGQEETTANGKCC